MADPRSPLQRHQARLLEALAALGVVNDCSLAGFCADLGIEMDRSTLVRYRSGERTAPLGLLPVLLLHAGQDAVAVLNLLARPLGLRVVPEAAGSPTDLVGALLAANDHMGRVNAEVRAGLADGHFDAAERARIRAAAGPARQALADLDAALVEPGSTR